jgi:hypothetical protein
MIDQVDSEIENKMLKLGVIEESNSPYSSPFVIVKKKDGNSRYHPQNYQRSVDPCALSSSSEKSQPRYLPCQKI